MQGQLAPVPVEAFYWFCGSALYTVTYNETAILMTLLILLYYSQSSSGQWRRIVLYIGIALFTVLVSGGTYVTLLLMLLLYFCYFSLCDPCGAFSALIWRYCDEKRV